jgi:hypothetical protein
MTVQKGRGATPLNGMGSVSLTARRRKLILGAASCVAFLLPACGTPAPAALPQPYGSSPPPGQLLAVAGDDSGQPQPSPSGRSCGDVVEMEDDGRSHVPNGQAHRFADWPSASGPHDERPLSAGVYTTPVADREAGFAGPTRLALVHSLEHGYIAVLHEGLKSSDQKLLTNRYGAEAKIIVAPDEGLPTAVVLVAWRRVRYCSAADMPRIDEFIRIYRAGGLAPEPTVP